MIYSSMMSMIMKSMISDDFLKLLSVKHLDLQYCIKVVILYNIVQCHRPPIHILSFIYITFSAFQFKQVWRWDVDQMLYFTLEKYKKC